MNRLPTGIDDGTLLYNFAGLPNEIMTGTHAGRRMVSRVVKNTIKIPTMAYL